MWYSKSKAKQEPPKPPRDSSLGYSKDLLGWRFQIPVTANTPAVEQIAIRFLKTAVLLYLRIKMKSINHRNIQLLRENLTAYNTTIACELPLPKFILDSEGKLFQKVRTVYESGQSRVAYSEVPVTALSSVEVVAGAINVS